MTLNDRVNRALARSKDPDPHSIARKLMARMDQAERDAALSECLADRVRIQITRVRLGGHPTTDAHISRTAGARTEGPSKWKAMIQARVYVPEVGWKFEIDLTVLDLRAVAAEYGERAAQMSAKQREYAKRADLLERFEFETWGEYLTSREQAA